MYFASASRASSALASRTVSPARAPSTALAKRSASKPASRSALPAGSSAPPRAASASSDATKSSPRRCASRSARLMMRPSSGETPTSPVGRPMRGSASSPASMPRRSRCRSTPAAASSASAPPSSSNAASRCSGATAAWSRPTAKDWAAASAVCRRVVSRSILMAVSTEWRCALSASAKAAIQRPASAAKASQDARRRLPASAKRQ